MLKFTARFLVLAISKAKADFFAKQCGITPEEVEEISKADPSPSSAYTGWLCNVYKKDKNMEAINELTSLLSAFMKISRNPEFAQERRDIGQYTPESLRALVGNPRAYRRNLSQKGIEKMIMEEGVPGAELVWNARGFKMWKVSSPRYAQFLSSNTHWCTAQPSYAHSYCSKGYLYPVYFQNKPLAQGYQGEKEASVAFLDREDQPIDLTKPEILLMLETIDLPVMKHFEIKTLSSSTLNSLISAKGKEGVEIAKKLALNSHNAQAMKAVVEFLSTEEWWHEGLEFLLDFPALLKDIVFNSPIKRLDKLREENPELAEEIAYELESNNYFTDSIQSLSYLLALGSTGSPDTISRVVDLIIEEGSNFGSNPVLTKAVSDKLKSTLESGSLERRAKTQVQRVLEKNQDNLGLAPIALDFWRDILNRKEWGCTLVSSQPEYQERIEAVKSAVKNPSVNMKVIPGPDYADLMGSKAVPDGTQGTVLQVSQEDGGNKYKVEVEWENGVKQELPLSQSSGIFTLTRAAGTKELSLIPVPCTRYRVGDLVTPNKENWNRWREVPAGTIGRITKIDDDTGGQLVSVAWPEDLPHYDITRDWGGFYARRFDKMIKGYVDENGKIVDEDGNEMADAKVDADSSGPYHALHVGDVVSIGGAPRRVMAGSDGRVYLNGGDRLIYRVIGGEDETEKHLYAERVSGESSNRGKVSPELTPEGLAQLANALINALG